MNKSHEIEGRPTERLDIFEWSYRFAITIGGQAIHSVQSVTSLVMLTLGAPSSSSSTRVLAPALDMVSTCCTVLPIGITALIALGGKTAAHADDEGTGSGFPEDKIVIPIGVTPQNLKNFSLYDMLGLSVEYADSADHEAIKKAYHKAVLAYQ
jgi:hypothetical protein